MKINMKIENKDIKRVVPPLRFPEFRNAEGWSEKTIDKACKSFSGGTPKTTEKDYYGGSIPFIRSAEINKEYTELFLTEEGLQNSAAKLVNKGDVLVALYGANSGDVAISKINGAINQAILCLKSKDSNRFICQYLTLIKNDIISTYIQGGQGNLSGEIIKSLKLLFPSPKEQQKIADCLGSLDDLISAVTDKIEALKEYKKGLMQQLFPAEGKTTPALRFPEFQNAGEWRQTTVENICEMQAGKFVSASDIYEKRESEMYPCYGGNGLRGYTYSFTHSGVYLLIGRQGALCGNVTFVDGTFHATEHAVVVTCKEGIVPHWLYYQFTKSNLNQYATGQAQPGLSVEVIKKVDVSIPKDNNNQIRKGEQQKIADCLSSVDELISTQADKLDQLKAHKKGLMQQLFPTLTNRL